MANQNRRPRPGDTNHDEEIARAMQRQFQRAENGKQRPPSQGRGQNPPRPNNPRRSPPSANRKAPPVNPRAPPGNQQRPPNQQRPGNKQRPPNQRPGNQQRSAHPQRPHHPNQRPPPPGHQQRAKTGPPNRRGTPMRASGISTMAVNADDRNLPVREKGPLPFSVVSVKGKKKKSKGEYPHSSSPRSRTALIPTGSNSEEEKNEIDDEDYAHQLEMSYRRGEHFNDDVGNESHFSDVEHAHRLEQELRDEQVAEQLQSILNQKERTNQNKREREKIIQGVPVRNAPFPVEKRNCSKKNFGYSAMTALLILGVFGALAIAFTGGNSTRWGDIFPDSDPFDGLDPGAPNKWRIESKTGLKMTMLNALDARWQPYFDIALADWDSGIPDSVSLSTLPTTYDKSCDRVRNKVKVCNGDYGVQDWKGICKVYLEFGYIAYATVQLNDFFFQQENPDDMQYTMCHELGHSLGLQHTDEDFYNKDLGNCMDYSVNPGFNMQPDEGNFQILFSLYGEVNIAEDAVRDSMNNAGTRFLEKVANLASTSEVEDVTTDILSDSWWRKLWKPSPSIGRMKLLFESKFSKLHVQDLGNGQTVLIHKILP